MNKFAVCLIKGKTVFSFTINAASSALEAVQLAYRMEQHVDNAGGNVTWDDDGDIQGGVRGMLHFMRILAKQGYVEFQEENAKADGILIANMYDTVLVRQASPA